MILTFSVFNRKSWFLIALICGYSVIAAVFLRNYLHWDSQWFIGLFLLPLVTQLDYKPKVSPIFLILALLFLAWAAYAQFTTVYFLAFLLVVWCSSQSVIGSVGIYPLLMLLFVSPLFSYIAKILSFPLRLQLTEWTVLLLKPLYPTVEAAGNLILWQGKEFSVDPACAGLNMLSFSLMMALLVLRHFENQGNHTWRWYTVGLFLTLMVVLNLICNMLRILILVIFQIPPENAMHEIIGLVCLLLYAVVPFYFIIKVLSKKTSTLTSTFQKPTISLSTKAIRLNIVLVMLLVAAGMRLEHKKIFSEVPPKQIAGFQREALVDGVQKLSSAQALIYFKPIKTFYSTEHHPLLCWEGSGYAFKHIREDKVAGSTIYLGDLEKGNDHLFTAWWMDNGQYQTIDQTDWRWRMLKGEPAFQLVNVSAATKKDLDTIITQLLQHSVNAPKLAVKQ